MRLVALGEQTFGAGVFGGFVKSFRSGMRRLDGYPGQMVSHRRLKQLGVSLRGESSTKWEVRRRHYKAQGYPIDPGEQPVPYPLFVANLQQKPRQKLGRKLSSSSQGPGVLVEVLQSHYKREVRLEVWVDKGAAAAAVGLLLAMSGEGDESVRTTGFWQGSLAATTIRLLGDGSATRGDALFEHLRSRAESFTQYRPLPSPHSLPLIPVNLPRQTQNGHIHPLGHLVVIWYA
jgi:hypothetical protein